MERFLFRKIEIWIVLVLVLIGIIGLVFFGAMVRNKAQGNDRFGLAGTVAYEIASIPVTVRDLLENEDRMTSIWGEERFFGMDGWVRTPAADAPPIPGYLLLSRYDGDRRNHVIELVDLTTFETVHIWTPSAETLFAGLEIPGKYVNTAMDDETFRAIHPFAMENGDLIIKDHYAPMARIDPCGRGVWTRTAPFHHASEPDAEGNIWAPSLFDPPQLARANGSTFEEVMAAVSPDGEIVFERSLWQVLVENGYEYLLGASYDGYDPDPIHLNDIQPVLSDGPFWQRGDLFLSMRHRSAVALYRPSTDKILWLQTGPWAFQHDVDILDDSRIAIFNNNTYNRPIGPEVDGANRISVYDFRTGETTALFEQALIDAEVRTISEGSFALLPSGHLLVEEENYGRLLIFAPDGSVAAEYVNGAGNGQPYRMGWSRYIGPDRGAAVAAALGAVDCAG